MRNLRITIATLTLICCVAYMSPFLAYALDIEEAPLGYLYSLAYGVIGIIIMDGRLMLWSRASKLVYGLCLALHLAFLLLMLNQWIAVVHTRELLAGYLAIHLVSAALIIIYIAKTVLHKAGGVNKHGI